MTSLDNADALQNLMLALDESGSPTASFLYGAFGEVVHEEGGAEHRRQFNGKEHDALTGLRYYGVRYYDALTLRWNSADPKYRFAPEVAWREPQRMNLYAFSLNSPLKYYDPDGREPTRISIAAKESPRPYRGDSHEAKVVHVYRRTINRILPIVQQAATEYNETHRDKRGASGVGGYCDRNIRNTNRKSPHASGRAVDIYLDSKDPNQKAMGDAIAETLAADPTSKAQAVIYNGKIWSKAKADQGWRDYAGTPHEDHVHVQWSASDANSTTDEEAET
jgi:RHS repeat-associated protein